MKWEALYMDWSKYSSDNGDIWTELPEIGVIKVKLITPDGHTMSVVGVDFYAIRPITREDGVEGYRVYKWKDTIANDIDGNPMYESHLNIGSIREYYDDCTGNAPNYIDASEVKKDLLPDEIKQGRWVDDKTAKQMGIL